MGFYQDRVVPFLLHHGMKDQKLARLRQRVAPHAGGRVLEIGVGSGLNLPFYSSDVTALFGIDPSPPLLARARQAASGFPFPTSLHEGSAEALPFDTSDFDCVVTTWTLCTIPDAARALAEIRRVLKPDGRLLFIEHGHAPDPRVAAWQDRLNPLWRRVAGGCNMNRPIDRMIGDGGFRIERLETGHLIQGPKPLTFLFEGVARPH